MSYAGLNCLKQSYNSPFSYSLCVGFPKKDIKTLVLIAKLASSFMKVACRAMGLKTRQTVKCYDKMVSLLVPPDGHVGIASYPIDVIRVEGNRNVIQAEEWKLRYEPEVQLRYRATGIAGDGALDSAVAMDMDAESSPEEEETPDASYKVATPVLGWNANLESTDEENKWMDPRSCCLCHMCGDDDAGFPDGSTYTPPAGTPHIARVGRLLPMADGYWVHASCAMWSSEVWEAQSGGTIHAMDKARSRGAQLKCFGCGRQGATVGCNKMNCSHNYRKCLFRIFVRIFTMFHSLM